MEFTKYRSIENSYQADFINHIRLLGFDTQQYLVQEKIHGVNFSFITNGSDILIASRSDVLAEDESFYNAKELRENYRSRVIELFEELKAKYDCKSIMVFGELCGGAYPHKDVENDPKIKLIQRSIYYCPFQEFVAFDILLDNEEYLDTLEAMELLDRHKFYYSKALFQGDLDECLAYPNLFKSTIYKEFGLPEINGNLCEGVVIRPLKTLYLNNGARVIIKNKNEKWAENNNYIDRELIKRVMVYEGDDEETHLSESAGMLCEEIFKLISENRLNNVASKIPEINPKKDYGRLLGLLSKDVLAEFFKNYKVQYDALEKTESKAINKFLNKEASKLVIDYLKNF